MRLNDKEHGRALDYYMSADTRRWHTKRDIPIQTVKEHTAGMLLLLDILHPNPSVNLFRAILRHDLPESVAFDAPHEVKNRYPFLREIDQEAEAEFNYQFNLMPIVLTDDEKVWLAYLDGLEVIFYIEASVRQPSNQSMEIFDNQMKRCIEFEKVLKAKGYFADPHETIQ